MVVLGNQSMRTKPLYLLTLGCVCADLLMGSFVLPLVIRTRLTRAWHPCDVTMALQVTSDYLVFFISGWTLVTQSFLLLHRHTTVLRCLPGLPSSLPKWVRTAVLVAWPWVVGVCISVGVGIRYAHKETIGLGYYDDEDILCMLRLDAVALVVMNVVCVMLPVGMLGGATVVLRCEIYRSPHSPGGMILLAEAHDVPSATDGDTPNRDTLASGGQHTTSNGTSANGDLVGEINTPNTNALNGTSGETSSPNGVIHQPVTSAHNSHNTQGDDTPAHTSLTDAAGGSVFDSQDGDWLRRIWVPNTVYIVCVVPFVVWDLSFRFGDLNTLRYNHNLLYSILQFVFTFLFFGKSYLLTISWLALNPVRRAVVEDFKKLSSCTWALLGNQPPSTSTTVSFSRLTSDVQA